MSCKGEKNSIYCKIVVVIKAMAHERVKLYTLIKESTMIRPIENL